MVDSMGQRKLENTAGEQRKLRDDNRKKVSIEVERMPYWRITNYLSFNFGSGGIQNIRHVK